VPEVFPQLTVLRIRLPFECAATFGNARQNAGTLFVDPSLILHEVTKNPHFFLALGPLAKEREDGFLVVWREWFVGATSDLSVA